MNNIARLRKEKGMSQISLSIKLHVSQKMISAYETGKNEPSIATLKSLADIFNTSIDYIVGYCAVRQPVNQIVKDGFSEQECELLNGFRALDSRKRLIAQGVILGLINAEPSFAPNDKKSY